MSGPVRTATFLNWVNVSVKADGQDAIKIISVTGMAPSRKNKIISFYGDAAAFARVKAAVEQERGITIISGDIATMLKIPMGIPLTVSGTLLDPRNGATAGGGAITVTLVNALVVSDGADAKNNQFANGTISFEAFAGLSDDGTTLVDPLSVTAV